MYITHDTPIVSSIFSWGLVIYRVFLSRPHVYGTGVSFSFVRVLLFLVPNFVVLVVVRDVFVL